MEDTDHRNRLIEKMREDWDARARENARHYVNTAKTDWADEEFFQSGQRTVAEEILTDMINICQGKNPKRMKVLEIGCGAGRVTRALSYLFGEVYAVDVSGEMVKQAQQALADRPNVHIFQNNGMDLTCLNARLYQKILSKFLNPLFWIWRKVKPDGPSGIHYISKGSLDFAFSIIVFQHIPSREIIENYVREVQRLLRPGALFKFQVQGYVALETPPEDTWLGVPFSDEDAIQMAQRGGFEPRYRHGAGGQYFWLWYFKRS